jgi:hypothetical protein
LQTGKRGQEKVGIRSLKILQMVNELWNTNPCQKVWFDFHSTSSALQLSVRKFSIIWSGRSMLQSTQVLFWDPVGLRGGCGQLVSAAFLLHELICLEWPVCLAYVNASESPSVSGEPIFSHTFFFKENFSGLS